MARRIGPIGSWWIFWRSAAQRGATSETLTCIDVDQDPTVYELPEFSGKIHAYGEAAVVRDGRIVFVTVLGKDKAQIQQRCAELWEYYEA